MKAPTWTADLAGRSGEAERSVRLVGCPAEMAQEEPARQKRSGGVGAEPEGEEVMRVAPVRPDNGQPVSSDGVRDVPTVFGLHTGDVGQHERELVHQLTSALYDRLGENAVSDAGAVRARPEDPIASRPRGDWISMCPRPCDTVTARVRSNSSAPRAAAARAKPRHSFTGSTVASPRVRMPPAPSRPIPARARAVRRREPRVDVQSAHGGRELERRAPPRR